MANTVHYKNLIQFIENSIGTKLFKNHFKQINDDIIDINEDGDLACAFYASNILLLTGLIGETHHMVKNTIIEMEKYDWYEVPYLKRGAVIIWEGKKNRHIGFCLNKNQAVSNLSQSKCPKKHHITFGTVHKSKKPIRKIEKIYWNDLLGKYQ